jgi:hypothetical protein
MAKIKAGKKSTLVDVMADNSDLTLAAIINQPLVGEPTMASRGSEAPELDDAITALLVMSGAQARWNWNFWLVTDKNHKRGHVAQDGGFDEWRRVLNDMAGGGFGE